jgi:hypothetical protein
MVQLFAVLLLACLCRAQTGIEPDPAEKEETHIMGMVPLYNAVETPHRFIPLTPKGKFKIAAEDSFDPYTWIVNGIYAGAEQLNHQDREFGQGAAGYAKRYGALFADQTIGTYFTEAILPVLFHEDPRYFRRGQGSAWKRAGYAITRVLITRNDSGGRRFNTSEILGNASGAAIGALYHAPSERSGDDIAERFALSMISDAGFNVLKEFWPDMRHKVLKR